MWICQDYIFFDYFSLIKKKKSWQELLSENSPLNDVPLDFCGGELSLEPHNPSLNC